MEASFCTTDIFIVMAYSLMFTAQNQGRISRSRSKVPMVRPWWWEGSDEFEYKLVFDQPHDPWLHRGPPQKGRVASTVSGIRGKSFLIPARPGNGIIRPRSNSGV